MPTSLNKYLDPAALDETVLNIRELIEGLEAEMQDLPYARPDGLYPDMTVGAVIGADDTAQWAQRESTGSGAATVRSVQGAAEVQDGALVPVRIAGIASTDAHGGELDAIDWPTQTLRAAGSVADVLYSDHVDVNVGVYTFTGNEVAAITDWRHVDGTYAAVFPLSLIPDRSTNKVNYISNAQMALIESVSYGALFDATTTGFSMATGATDSMYSFIVRVPTSIASTQSELMSWLAGQTLYYELATPTTTPITPALPMTYRVEQGGSESIIVPTGEISAAPVLTVAEPVNAGDEFARIWAAIESLGYTRNAAQLSRPVSLTDIGSIDEVQKDTAEIDTTKEVTE